MAVLKTTFVLLLIALSMVIVTDAVRVGQCDQVCNRIVPERNECCRANGYRSYNNCNGGRMDCNR
ncbi:hypothetical protein ABMA27_011205 [Loxostege sticticalis]|uniref:Uncharacterized protein n=1 Tax=Loxostege sticticalis TaxID=481309 RepID=A0ABR3H1N8_LOXSC